MRHFPQKKRHLYLFRRLSSCHKGDTVFPAETAAPKLLVLPRPLCPGLHKKNMFPRTPYSFPREEVVVAAAKSQKAPPSSFCIVPPPSSKVLRIPNLKLKKAYVANWGLQIASKEGGPEWSKRRVFLPKTINLCCCLWFFAKKNFFRKIFRRAKFINIG